MLKINKELKNNKGFTLVELLVVVAIIGILAAVIVPRITSSVQDAKDASASAQQSTIINALERYNAKVGSYPTVADTLDALYPDYLTDKPSTNSKFNFDYKLDAGKPVVTVTSK